MGEITIANELLYAKIDKLEAGRPLAGRRLQGRSKRLSTLSPPKARRHPARLPDALDRREAGGGGERVGCGEALDVACTGEKLCLEHHPVPGSVRTRAP
nr:hypothetical protein [Cereibacter sphaeroides]